MKLRKIGGAEGVFTSKLEEQITALLRPNLSFWSSLPFLPSQFAEIEGEYNFVSHPFALYFSLNALTAINHQSLARSTSDVSIVTGA